MQMGFYRMMLSLALVCLINLAANAAQDHHRSGGDPANRAGGKITAINGASITVQGREGNATTIGVSTGTQYTRNGQAAALADFKVGDFVFAHGTRNADGQFVADRVMGGDQPPERGRGRGHGNGVFGELQSVNSAAHTLTVKSPDGATQTIYTTGSTEFSRNQQTATLVDFKVGDHVGASGSQNADGHFVADHVFGGNTPPRQRRQ